MSIKARKGIKFVSAGATRAEMVWSDSGYLSLKVADTEVGRIGTGGLVPVGSTLPSADATDDLGSASYQFRDLYLSRNIINSGGFIRGSVQNAITAHAGGTQAAAYALTKQINFISVCATAGDSVRLPASVAGMAVYIYNGAALAAQVYGASTDTINGVATGTGVTLPAGTGAVFYCNAAGTWLSNEIADLAKIQLGSVTVDGLLGGAGSVAADLALGAAAGNGLNIRLGATHTTGDMRGIYLKLTFTGAGGSGEALRAYARVNNVSVATGGTVNGAHITLGIDGAAGAVSGAGNALRATLGLGASANPGGTLSAIQIDSDFDNAATVDAKLPAIRLTNSNTKVWPVLMEIPNVSNGTIFAAHDTQAMTHSIKIKSADGTLYYIMCASAATNRS